jgi:hypothetical protein
LIGKPSAVTVGGVCAGEVPPSSAYDGRSSVTLRENGGLSNALLMKVPINGRV